MDSLSQIALGAAVSVAVAGPRVGYVRAAAWGAACGTLPDLDALIDHGDPVHNMTLHRAESHALFYLALVSPLIAVGIAKLHGQWAQLQIWWLAVFLALVTHPLLDTMTIYGTQLARPFSSYPFGVGSIFIIDPLYTLPLLIGVAIAVYRRDARGLRWNTLGLALSTAYLGWGVAAQAHVRGVAEEALARQGIAFERLLVQPTAFNSLLWRIVAVEHEAYHEGFHSLLAPASGPSFERLPRHPELHAPLRAHDPVARLTDFSHGYWEMREQDGQILMADLRMGQAPWYYFTFVVAERDAEGLRAVAARAVGERPPISGGLRWLWQRLLGQEPGTLRVSGREP